MLGLDLDLQYESENVTVVSVSTTKQTKDFVLTSGDTGGLLRLSMYGNQPLAKGGLLLELIIESKIPGASPNWFLDAQINEGAIECVAGP